MKSQPTLDKEAKGIRINVKNSYVVKHKDKANKGHQPFGDGGSMGPLTARTPNRKKNKAESIYNTQRDN